MQANGDDRNSLLRVLGPWTAVAVVIGSMIGSGVFKKPQAIAEDLPYFELAAVAWILGGVLALLGALALAELGAMLPRAGGSYVYLKDGYSPLWGFLWGWVEFWIIRTGSIAALATIFSESLAEIVRPVTHLDAWEQRWLTVGVIMLLAGVNALGVRWGGLIQNITTCIKIGSLLTIAVLPFVLGQTHPENIVPFSTAPGGYLANLSDAAAEGSLLSAIGGLIVKFGAVVLSVLWAYHGWMNLSALGEELKEPRKSVPRALLLGVAIVIVVYLSANLAYALVLPQDVMADKTQVRVVAISFAEWTLAPWSAQASQLAGNLVAAAIMVSVFGALNSSILVGPRAYFALGRDGLFPFLGHVNPYFRTPARAILIQAGWCCALVLGSDLLKDHETADPFDTLTNYVMFGAIIFETMVIGSIFTFRWRQPTLERPYRCWGYPWTPLAYVVIMAGVLVVTLIDQPRKSAIGAGFIVVGALAYFISRWLVRMATRSASGPAP